MQALVLTALFFLIAGNAVAQEPKALTVKTIATIQKSVVPVVCLGLNSDNQVFRKATLGTGFLINRNGQFLTAGHVARGIFSIPADQCTPAIYLNKQSWRDRSVTLDAKWFKIEKCSWNNEIDIGVCRTIDNPFSDALVNKNIAPVVLDSFLKYPDGTPVAFTAFPLQSLIPITSQANIAAYDVNAKKLIIDKTSWEGASGSPLYSGDGKVIAIMTEAGTDKSAGFAMARPVELAITYLREQKIPFEK
ncbi:MAG TPA: serine protease [Pyrinomonadaceae bacterium]|jgi:hypothetical protein